MHFLYQSRQSLLHPAAASTGIKKVAAGRVQKAQWRPAKKTERKTGFQLLVASRLLHSVAPAPQSDGAGMPGRVPAVTAQIHIRGALGYSSLAPQPYDSSGLCRFLFLHLQLLAVYICVIIKRPVLCT
jgi:hypothetical protein